MKKTLRATFTLKIHAYNLLKSVTPKTSSMSAVLSELILKTFQDPIKRLDKERREHIIKANEISDKIKHLEELREEHAREKTL